MFWKWYRLVEIRAAQRTFEGAYIRTALGQFSFALVVLKIFTAEFYSIGALFATYGAGILMVSLYRRYEGNRQFFSEIDGDGMGRKKFRTSGNAVVVLTTLSLVAYVLLIGLTIRLETWNLWLSWLYGRHNQRSKHSTRHGAILGSRYEMIDVIARVGWYRQRLGEQKSHRNSALIRTIFPETKSDVAYLFNPILYEDRDIYFFNLFGSWSSTLPKTFRDGCMGGHSAGCLIANAIKQAKKKPFTLWLWSS